MSRIEEQMQINKSLNANIETVENGWIVYHGNNEPQHMGFVSKQYVFTEPEALAKHMQEWATLGRAMTTPTSTGVAKKHG